MERNRKQRYLQASAVLACLLVTGCGSSSGSEQKTEELMTTEDGTVLSDDASDFVLLSDAVPDAILEIRYYSTYNFLGDRIDGYEEPGA